jgi:hypothetical protein
MIVSNPPSRLVKHIIRSYARLAENTRVRPVLKENLPGILKDKIFYQNLDDSSKRWLQNLMKLLSSVVSGGSGIGGNMGNMAGGIGGTMGNMAGNIGGTMGNMPNTTGPYSNMGMNVPMGNNYQYGDSFIDQNANGKNLYKNYLNMNSNVFIYKNGK